MSYEYYGPGLGTNGTSSGTSTTSSAERRDDAQPETVFERGWEWFREIASGKDQPAAGAATQTVAAPMPGATADGKPTAEGFAEYAQEAAVRATAAVDEEQAPIEEVPPESEAAQAADEQSWIERYQTHITLFSTVAGLVTFGIWLLVRKRD